MNRRISPSLMLAGLLAASVPSAGQDLDRQFTEDELATMLERFRQPRPAFDLKTSREQFLKKVAKFNAETEAYQADVEQRRIQASERARAEVARLSAAVEEKQAEVRNLEARLDARRAELIEALVALNLAEQRVSEVGPTVPVQQP